MKLERNQIPHSERGGFNYPFLPEIKKFKILLDVEKLYELKKRVIEKVSRSRIAKRKEKKKKKTVLNVK